MTAAVNARCGMPQVLEVRQVPTPDVYGARAE